MTDKRLCLLLLPLAVLAACDQEPADDGRAATGEVLEGTISDAMLPVDRVRSEPPLEDPEAFAEAQEEASEEAGGTPGSSTPVADVAEPEEEPAEEPEPEAE